MTRRLHPAYRRFVKNNVAVYDKSMNRKTGAIILSIILIGGLTAAAWYVLSSYSGCNKLDTSQSQKSITNNGTSSPASVAATTISITRAAFSPSTTTVKKGASLTWVNKDATTHALDEVDKADEVSSSDNQASIRSPQLKPNESYTFTFAKAGTYKYRCVLHPELTGTITVIN